jgi:hypothetical protein
MRRSAKQRATLEGRNAQPTGSRLQRSSCSASIRFMRYSTPLRPETNKLCSATASPSQTGAKSRLVCSSTLPSAGVVTVARTAKATSPSGPVRSVRPERAVEPGVVQISVDREQMRNASVHDLALAVKGQRAHEQVRSRAQKDVGLGRDRIHSARGLEIRGMISAVDHFTGPRMQRDHVEPAVDKHVPAGDRVDQVVVVGHCPMHGPDGFHPPFVDDSFFRRSRPASPHQCAVVGWQRVVKGRAFFRADGSCRCLPVGRQFGVGFGQPHEAIQLGIREADPKRSSGPPRHSRVSRR